MYYNAQKFVKAILAENRYDQLLRLCQCVTQTGSAKGFYKHMRNTMTLMLKHKHGKKYNESMLNSAEFDITQGDAHTLLKIDPAIKALYNNKKGIPIFISPLEYSFGMLCWGRPRSEIKVLDQKVREF